MSERWKSQPKKFCEICKCWFGDNKASIQHHENGMRHKAGVQQKLRDLGKKSKERDAESKETMGYLAEMERGAMQSYKKDLAASAQLGASYGLHPSIGPAPKGPAKRAVPRPGVPDVMFPGAEQCSSAQLPPPHPVNPAAQAKSKGEERKIDRNKKWAEAVTPDGFSYYWHYQTGETSWEVPKEGFLSLADQQYLEEQVTRTGGQEVKREKDERDKLRENVINDIMSAVKESEETRKRREELKASQRPNFVSGVSCPTQPPLPDSIPLPPQQAPSAGPPGMKTEPSSSHPSAVSTGNRGPNPQTESHMKNEPVGVDDRRPIKKEEPEENEEIERLMNTRKEPTGPSPFGSWQTVDPTPKEEVLPDLGLPKSNFDEPEISYPEFPHDPDDEPVRKFKFKEKKITSLASKKSASILPPSKSGSNPSSAPTFKKRKLGSGTKNLRNRDD